jgi:hypothetical protein
MCEAHRTPIISKKLHVADKMLCNKSMGKQNVVTGMECCCDRQWLLRTEPNQRAHADKDSDTVVK